MAEILISNLDSDGEVRRFPHGRATLANVGGVSMLRGEYEPGWRWATDMAPIVGTDSCRIRHQGHLLTGTMRVRLDDGDEIELRAGDIFEIPPGHDAWVIGDETCTMIDVSAESTQYAVNRQAGIAAAEDEWMALVRRGYEAFNSGDIDTLVDLFAEDVQQHVPGHSELAGAHKGRDAVLGYYGQLAQMTDGTFRADLVDLHGDGNGHVLAVHQTSSTRNGVKRVSRGSILFTLVGHKVHDLLEFRGDLPGDEAHLA